MKIMILSLGSLLENVNIQTFIVQALTWAQRKEPQFKFEGATQNAALSLAAEFNRGQFPPDIFKAKLLAILGLKDEEIEPELFWSAWNSMLTIGDLNAQIKNLRSLTEARSILLYFYSDTNPIHAQVIASKATELFNLTPNQSSIAHWPLYLTYESQLPKDELIKKMMNDISNKTLPVECVQLFLGDARAVVNPGIVERLQQQHAKVTEFGYGIFKEKSIPFSVHVLSKPLAECLMSALITPVATYVASTATKPSQFQNM